MAAEFGVEEDAGKKNPAAVIKARKEYLMRETDKFLGISVTDDLLPHLGDKVVVFQSPTEGLQVFGTVVCVSVKDAAKVRTAADRVQRALEAIANSPIKVRKKVLKGVEYREFYARGFGIITPTYAVVGDWLVVAGHPQAVQGVILRSKGDLEKWAPDDATAKRLAKMPADGCGLQFCDPKSTTGNVCCIGPFFLSAFGPMVQRLPTVDFGLQLQARTRPGASSPAAAFSASGFHFSRSPFDLRITPTSCGCPAMTSQSPTTA